MYLIKIWSFFITGGEGCSDKFKNCHLVVQARLCKLKYYLVSCCASCSKPKTWSCPEQIEKHARSRTTQTQKRKETVSSPKTWCFLIFSHVISFYNFFFKFLIFLVVLLLLVVSFEQHKIVYRKRKVVANFLISCFLGPKLYAVLWIKPWLSVRHDDGLRTKGNWILFCGGDGDRIRRLHNTSRLANQWDEQCHRWWPRDKLFAWQIQLGRRGVLYGHMLFGWLLLVCARAIDLYGDNKKKYSSWAAAALAGRTSHYWAPDPALHLYTLKEMDQQAFYDYVSFQSANAVYETAKLTMKWWSNRL